MRIWSLHPSLLDSKGLVACWRETLLAQKVLLGLTTGYKNHPQLERFKAHPEPIAAVAVYLHALADEAEIRSYNFDRSRIVLSAPPEIEKIPVTNGQITYEFSFLKYKVEGRDPLWFSQKLIQILTVQIHPLFKQVNGDIEVWEKIKEFPTE